MIPMLLPPMALLVALAVDRWAGEPPVRRHPVVWMGNYLGWAGKRLQQVAVQEPLKSDFKVFWLGALMWFAGVAIVLIVSFALESCLMALPNSLGSVVGGAVGALLMGLLLKPMLAWAMLKREVMAVEQALDVEAGGSLAAGRERLSWLVSRDVSGLTEFGVRESAIESLAENFNDSVVAPIFWFVLLGLPGAAVYRFANTADAMWGYRGVYKGRNWEWAGKWAAVADDVLSWVPARITAALIALVSGRVNVRRLLAEAPRTPSPNSGWPMAAMALALGVCLRKPGVYVLNEAGRRPVPQDTRQSHAYASKALVVLVLIAQAAMVYVAIFALFLGPVP
jgi:adenosylcobinamide-phosphate synthase